MVLIVAPSLVALAILPFALIGILAILVRYPLSGLPAFLLGLGSLTTTAGIYLLMGDATATGRLVAVSGMAMALLGYFLDDIGKKR